MIEEKIKDAYERIQNNVMCFANGLDIYEWIRDCYPALKIYEKNNVYIQQIIEWYRYQADSVFLMELREADDKLRNHRNYMQQIGLKMNNGEKVMLWVGRNREKLEYWAAHDNSYALSVLENYIEPVEFHRNRDAKNINLFLRRLRAYKEYMEEYGKEPDSSDIYFEGTHISMMNWVYKYPHSYMIKKYAKLGDKDAEYVLRYREYIKRDMKLKELLDYLNSNLRIPEYQDDVFFSDGMKMGLWLLNNKRKILDYYDDDNYYAISIVNLLLKIDSSFYNLSLRMNLEKANSCQYTYHMNR